MGSLADAMRPQYKTKLLTWFFRIFPQLGTLKTCIFGKCLKNTVHFLILLILMFLFPAMEWIGVSKRSWGVCVIQLFGAVGQCFLAGLVYGIRNWRLSQLVGASLYAITAIYIWYTLFGFVCSMFCVILEVSCRSFFFFFLVSTRFIPESARWLLSRGRTEEAKQLISKAARINKRNVPEFLLEKVFSITGKWHNRAVTGK